jgi:hypothetical protein
MMSQKLEKIFAELEAEEPERYSQDWFEVIQHRFPLLKPNQKAQLLASLTREEILASRTPEERLAGLSTEQKSQALAGLSPEEKLEWFKTLQKELGQQPN